VLYLIGVLNNVTGFDKMTLYLTSPPHTHTGLYMCVWFNITSDVTTIVMVTDKYTLVKVNVFVEFHNVTPD